MKHCHTKHSLFLLLPAFLLWAWNLTVWNWSAGVRASDCFSCQLIVALPVYLLLAWGERQKRPWLCKHCSVTAKTSSWQIQNSPMLTTPRKFVPADTNTHMLEPLLRSLFSLLGRTICNKKYQSWFRALEHLPFDDVKKDNFVKLVIVTDNVITTPKIYKRTRARKKSAESTATWIKAR